MGLRDTIYRKHDDHNNRIYFKHVRIYGVEMTEPKTLEQQLKEKQDEINELKRKLEDRNPAFNGNLLRKTDQEFRRLSVAIGESIKNVVGQELVHAFKQVPMRLDYQSYSYATSGNWVVFFSAKDEEKIKQDIADNQMKKFQESLDNFSWAVNNQAGG